MESISKEQALAKLRAECLTDSEQLVILTEKLNKNMIELEKECSK